MRRFRIFLGQCTMTIVSYSYINRIAGSVFYAENQNIFGTVHNDNSTVSWQSNGFVPNCWIQLNGFCHSLYTVQFTLTLHEHFRKKDEERIITIWLVDLRFILALAFRRSSNGGALYRGPRYRLGHLDGLHSCHGPIVPSVAA